MIGCKNYLTLDKSEWNRLRRKPSPETMVQKREQYFKTLNEQSQKWIKVQKREQYFKALNEQSQKWIKHWPDTTHTYLKEHVRQMKKQNIIEQAKIIETYKNIDLKKKQDNTPEAIKKAKEFIFAASCYGRQLTSALLESKTIEERDLQIKFQNELKAKYNASKLIKPQGSSLLDSKQIEIDETRNKLQGQQFSEEVAKFNAEEIKMQKEKRRKGKEEKKLELEDAKLNNEFTKKSAELEKNMAYQVKQTIKEFEAENKKNADFRSKREEQDELRREIWRKYQDRTKCREKDVFNKTHKEKYDSPQYQKVYKTIQNSEENKNKKYNEFVQKGIEKWLDRSNKREQKEMENRTSLRNHRKLLDEENKIQSEFQNGKRIQEMKKWACWKQCILPKCSGAAEQEACHKKKDASIPSFLLSKNKYVEDLKARQVEPTPWTALKAAHEQFSQHASSTLQECRYNNAARKVVDDYRRLNCLDSKTLPVSNYY